MKQIIINILACVVCAVFIVGCVGISTSSNSTSNAKSESLVLVIGITGNQGGGVAEAVLAEGFKVRGLTRNIDSDAAKAWSTQGVEMVQGDFNDYDSIKAAVKGVDYLFLNITEQTPNFVAAANHAFDAAHEAGVKHIVFSSNRVAEPESGFVIETPNHKRSMEQYIRQSGYSYSTLRIPFMMENLMRERDMRSMLTQGTVDYGEEGTLGYYINSADMGLLVAAAFSDPTAWNGREVNMASDALTPKEVAALLSKLTGTEIKYRTAPWSEMRGPFVENFKWFEQGGGSYDLTQLRQEFPAIQTLEEYLVSNHYAKKFHTVAASPAPAEQVGGMGMGGQ